MTCQIPDTSHWIEASGRDGKVIHLSLHRVPFMKLALVKSVSVATSIAVVTSCSQQQQYAPSPPPPPDRLSYRRVVSTEERLQGQGRAAWQMASSLERQQRFPEALNQYLQAGLLFDETLRTAAADHIPLASRPPAIYLDTAKCHVDIARLLGRARRDQRDVYQHLSAAESVLHQLEDVHSIQAALQGPFWQPWAWRIYYLLGDVNLLQNRLNESRRNYLIASNLNHDHPVPSAIALARFLGEAQQPRPEVVRAPAPPSRNTALTNRSDPKDAATRERIARANQAEFEARAAVAAAEAAKVEAEAAEARLQQMRKDRAAAEAVIAEAQRTQKARADEAAAAARAAEQAAIANKAKPGGANPARPVQPQSDADGILRGLNAQFSVGRLLEYGAVALPLAADVLEFVALGPVGWVGGLAMLTGMALQDWDKAKKSANQTSR